jgi:hypothetical protein
LAITQRFSKDGNGSNLPNQYWCRSVLFCSSTNEQISTHYSRESENGKRQSQGAWHRDMVSHNQTYKAARELANRMSGFRIVLGYASAEKILMQWHRINFAISLSFSGLTLYEVSHNAATPTTEE